MTTVIPAIAVAAGAVAQAVSGIGFSLVCAPVLIATLGPREGVRTALLLSSVLNVALVVGKRDDVLVKEGALLLVPALAVTPLVAAAAKSIDARYLAGAAGVLTIVSAAALAAGRRSTRAAGSPVAAVVAGLLSGTMNVVGSIGGPALALFTVNAGWPPHRTRPTLQVIFLLSNIVALTALGLPSPDRIPALTAGLVIGSVVGIVVARWVSPEAATKATLAVAAIGGLAAVTRAFRPL